MEPGATRRARQSLAEPRQPVRAWRECSDAGIHLGSRPRIWDQARNLDPADACTARSRPTCAEKARTAASRQTPEAEVADTPLRYGPLQISPSSSLSRRRPMGNDSAGGHDGCTSHSKRPLRPYTSYGEILTACASRWPRASPRGRSSSPIRTACLTSSFRRWRVLGPLLFSHGVAVASRAPRSYSPPMLVRVNPLSRA